MIFVELLGYYFFVEFENYGKEKFIEFVYIKMLVKLVLLLIFIYFYVFQFLNVIME